MWLISQDGKPGPQEVGSHSPWDESEHSMGRLWEGREEVAGQTLSTTPMTRTNLPFSSPLWGAFAWLLFLIVNMT